MVGDSQLHLFWLIWKLKPFICGPQTAALEPHADSTNICAIAEFRDIKEGAGTLGSHSGRDICSGISNSGVGTPGWCLRMRVAGLTALG